MIKLIAITTVTNIVPLTLGRLHPRFFCLEVFLGLARTIEILWGEYSRW